MKDRVVFVIAGLLLIAAAIDAAFINFLPTTLQVVILLAVVMGTAAVCMAPVNSKAKSFIGSVRRVSVTLFDLGGASAMRGTRDPHERALRAMRSAWDDTIEPFQASVAVTYHEYVETYTPSQPFAAAVTTEDVRREIERVRSQKANGA